MQIRRGREADTERLVALAGQIFETEQEIPRALTPLPPENRPQWWCVEEDGTLLGGVALYYLGMYNDAFTIRDFWQIRTAGWIGLAAVVLLTAGQVIKAIRRSVSARRSARQAERDEKTRQKELEDARTRAYAAGQEDAKAAARVAENVSAADSRENP